MTMKKFIMVAALVFCTSASAEGFFGVGLGVATGYPTYVDDANTAALTGTAPGFWSAYSEQKGKIGYDIFGGYWAGDSLGLEVGYKHLGGISGTTNLIGPGFNRTDDFKLSGSSVYGAMLWRPASTSSFFAKAGMHSTSMTLETSGIGNILTVGPNTSTVSSNGMIVGVGFDLKPVRIGLDYFAGVKVPKLTYPSLTGTKTASLLEINFNIVF